MQSLKLCRPTCTRSLLTSRLISPSASKRSIIGGLGLSSLMLSVGSSAPRASAKASSEAEKVLQDPNWPPAFPFKADMFKRFDETVDTEFYSAPRFVYHIDEAAVEAVTRYYSEVFPPSGNKDVALLDLCSSWVSHYPKGYTAGRIVGLGMVKEELERNPQLTECTVQDLNINPILPYPDNTFDVVTNCVSVDYLTKPLEIFRETHRVLKPGGRAIMTFSNRCFPTKAISIWTQTGDLDHIWIVGSYFHYSVPGGFQEPVGVDISPNPGRSDPMYVVYGLKK